MREPSNLKMYVLSLCAGAIYPFGFAPFSWWPLSLMSVGLIFAVWQRLSAKNSGRAQLWSTLLYGLSTFGVGVSWVYVSMVNFGNMSPPLAVIAVFLFALILTVFYLGLVWVYARLAPYASRKHQLIFILPVLWVLFEWLRSVVLTGFPWLQLGYASVGTWYSSWAGLSGILSVSLVWAMLAGYGAYKFQSFKLKNMAAFSLMLMLVSAASWGLQQTRWTEQVGAPLEVALVQADIPLSVKWQAKNRENLMQTYLAASRAVIDADLIVWPEGALPMVLDDIPEDYINDLRALDADVAFGAIERKEGRLYNGISLLSEQNDQQYRKQHLVPFGEFFPLKWLLGGLFETLQIPMSDFTGFNEAQSNFSIKGIKILPTICYEDAFPEDWRAQVADSNMILNISEDAWFGDSFAPHQRLQMAQMRAIEFQRPMIRVSNSGLSTVINDDGSVDQLSPQFQPALFSAPVFPMQGQTPYTRYGLWPLWGLSLALLVFAYVRQKRKASS